MKNYAFLLLFFIGLFNPVVHFAQGFTLSKDTVDSDVDKGSYTAKVNIPKGSLKAKSIITFAINKSKTDVTELNVPFESTYTIKDATKDEEASYKVAFNRDNNNDRKLSFEITVKDPEGNVFKLPEKVNSTLDVQIRSHRDFEKTDNEYWVFVGTNFDLLDGVKARDLYFRGSFLVPLNNSNPKKSQFYITFEKNRFFSERDSLSRIRLTDVLPMMNKPDSMRLVQGYYNTFRETVTENIGFSLSHIANFKAKPEGQYNFYFMSGIYIDYQTRTSKYTNHSIQADTTTIRKDTGYHFTPLASQSKSQSWNTNFYVGAMYIHSGTSVNLKTFLQVGVNFNNFPSFSRISGLNQSTEYTQNKAFYTRFHLDATLLESPGLSFGAEVYLRKGLMPLFNFTAAKVFDLRQLKTLFSKLPSQ